MCGAARWVFLVTRDGHFDLKVVSLEEEAQMVRKDEGLQVFLHDLSSVAQLRCTAAHVDKNPSGCATELRH